MRTYVQPGKEINFVAGAAIKSGDVVVIGSFVGVAAADYASGQVGVAELEGVHRLKKKTGDVVTQGLKLYWDATAKEVTITASTNAFIGYAFDAQIGTDVTVKVKLLPAGS